MGVIGDLHIGRGFFPLPRCVGGNLLFDFQAIDRRSKLDLDCVGVFGQYRNLQGRCATMNQFSKTSGNRRCQQLSLLSLLRSSSDCAASFFCATDSGFASAALMDWTICSGCSILMSSEAGTRRTLSFGRTINAFPSDSAADRFARGR